MSYSPEKPRSASTTQSPMALLGKVMDHEFRTPLQTIATFLHVTETVVPQADQAIHRAANEACGYLHHLHQDLVTALEELDGDVAKPGASAQEIVAWLLERGEPLAHTRGMTLIATSHLPQSLAITRAPWLRYALWNLVRNALTHGPEGGTVELRWDRVPSHDVITIRDDGQGPNPLEPGRLHASDVAALYGPEETRVRGLTLSALLSERMGGFLAFDRSAEHGATFALTLPRESFPTESMHP